MNLSELRDWVRRRLGAPVIKVELTDAHITDAYNASVDKYLYYNRPKEDYYYFQTLPGQYIYGPADFSEYKEAVEKVSDLPLSGNEDNDIRFVNVEGCAYRWSSSSASWSVYVPSTTIPVDVLATARDVVYQPITDIVSQLAQASADFFLAYYFKRSGGMFIADLWIAMSAKETFNYVLGLQPTWEILNNQLYLSPKPQASVKIGIKYAVPPSEEYLCSHEWVGKATLALSKMTLGTIRGKFASIPGPAGEGISLAGETLKVEGKAEWDWLLQDIIGRSEPLSFSVG